jgi:hypothetical protein
MYPERGGSFLVFPLGVSVVSPKCFQVKHAEMGYNEREKSGRVKKGRKR